MGIIFVTYCIVGRIAVKYVKASMPEAADGYVQNLFGYFWRLVFGWFSIHAALIH